MSMDCRIVTQPGARKQILLKAGRCFVCLCTGHVSRECHSKLTCTVTISDGAGSLAQGQISDKKNLVVPASVSMGPRKLWISLLLQRLPVSLASYCVVFSSGRPTVQELLQVEVHVDGKTTHPSRYPVTLSILLLQCISTSKVPLTFNKLEKTKLGNFNFVHLLSSSTGIAQKVQCMVSANFKHTKRLPC